MGQGCYCYQDQTAKQHGHENKGQSRVFHENQDWVSTCWRMGKASNDQGGDDSLNSFG